MKKFRIVAKEIGVGERFIYNVSSCGLSKARLKALMWSSLKDARKYCLELMDLNPEFEFNIKEI
jgi:hypothetical protein